MLNKAEVLGTIKSLKRDIAAYRKMGLHATVAHLERKLKAAQTRLAEMGRVHNRALLEIRTRNGDAFRGDKWDPVQ